MLAFAPVSFMLRALKNDIVALEYPINHFISQCIRHGESPLWFNTWGMGFPLDSNLTWGVYSTPQMLFNTIFNYDIYALHIEFMFFILLAGWSMFYLLNRFFLPDRLLAQLLAICYMLSGFMVGSTQWLLYITAAAFIPLVLAGLLELLQRPSYKNAFKLAILYTMMFTSVYAAFNIITTYSLVLFTLIYLFRPGNPRITRVNQAKFLLFAVLGTVILCYPCLAGTLELLKHISRGEGIDAGSTFFESNYLHPRALSSMLLPFSSVRMQFPNTEGTMLNSYAGLLVLVLLPFTVYSIFKNRDKTAIAMLGAGLLFLVVSFGSITPLRNLLNYLPGFSYFRNPAIFRFYFIGLVILTLAWTFRKSSFAALFDRQASTEKWVRYTLLLLMVLPLIELVAHFKSVQGIFSFSFSEVIKTMDHPRSECINAVIQLLLLLFILVFFQLRKWKLAGGIFAVDLVINTLICTPYFSVSSYSLPEVNHILKPVPGFPVQKSIPAEEITQFRDEKGNTWYNVNVFSKTISSHPSYRGPLELNSPLNDSTRRNYREPLVYAESNVDSSAIIILKQKPAHVRVKTNFIQPQVLTLQQKNYYGWKIRVNGKAEPRIVAFSEAGKELQAAGPGISVSVPSGEAIVDFKYKPKEVWISAIFVHLAVLSYFISGIVFAFRRRFRKSSSLS
jgi:hypothetical protein